MKVALIEPFFIGSHALWSFGLQKFSRHHIEIFSLKGKYWKWRMHGGAVSLAQSFVNSDFLPDLILAGDMLDLTTFLALSRKKSQHIPCAIYFHENQITYPWSPTDPDIKLKRDNQYGFINYTSALAADACFFNSTFHKASFLQHLPTFLSQFPDYQGLDEIDGIRDKSVVLPLGLDLKELSIISHNNKPEVAVILWNHRWEYDKNPDTFFKVLFRLKEQAIPFQLIILGKSYARTPPVFEEAKSKLAKEIIHFGFTDNREDYAQFLHLADILPVTSWQDFFGGSIVEAIACNCYPILPNRLAYPEHIPPTFREEHLYHSEEELFQKLKAAVLNISLIRSKNYTDFVADYDWRNLVAKYDAAFETLAQ